MRIIDISKFNYEYKMMNKFFDNSFLLQEKDDLVFDKKKLKYVTKTKPTSKSFHTHKNCKIKIDAKEGIDNGTTIFIKVS